jgi:hypothetical protein
VEERGPGYSLQRAFQRYEALGRDGSVSADEFRALLRNFNLEVEHDDLAYIVAACRPLPPTTTSSYARTPGTTPGRDASGLPRLDCRRFMERLKGLDNSALASSTPLSGSSASLICSLMPSLRVVWLHRPPALGVANVNFSSALTCS